MADRDRDEHPEPETDDVGARPYLSSGPPPAVYPVELDRDSLDRDAMKVAARLTRNGYEAYLVGGGVRDLLLGQKPKDFDVATSAQPQEVRKLFRNCRVIGRRFRLAHVIFGRKIIEVATFRKDPSQRFSEEAYIHPPEGCLRELPHPQRLIPLFDSTQEDDLLIRNDNVFGRPHEDAVRRDFTINGLFYDFARKEVVDYVGGMQDVRRRVIRTIGEPGVRFREDPVRILRAIKFSARIDLGIEPDVYDAMVECRGELEKAARPRLYEELLRFLRGGSAHRSIYLAWDTGVLAELLPELSAFLDDEAEGVAQTWNRLMALDELISGGEVPGEAVLLTALLLGPIEEALEGQRQAMAAFEDFFEEVSERLAVPRRIKDQVRMLVGAMAWMRRGKVAKLQRRDIFGEAVQLFLLECAANGSAPPEWALKQIPTREERPKRRRRRRRRR